MILALLLLLKMIPECPVDGYVTSVYGFRHDPITGRRRWHGGVDLGAPKGSPIRALWMGTVTRLRRSSRGYGNQVVIRRGQLRVRYAHAQELSVYMGDTVLAGQEIGTVGSTGRATGAHLHLEMMRGKRSFNPGFFVLRCPSGY